MAVAMDVSKFINVYLYNVVKYNFDIIPVMSGNPGISKTHQLHQLCEKCDWGLVPVHLALRPLESLSGLPEIKEVDGVKLTEWSMPEIISQANELAKEKEKVILFFDDIHLADKSRQSYFFELATERAIAGHKLADNVKIVCAGNTTSKAGKKTFLSAIVNRFTFVNVMLESKSWLNWAVKDKKTTTVNPVDIRNEDKFATFKEINIHPIIIGFIYKNESLLSTPEDTAPFASPRSWYYTSEWLKLFELVYSDVNKWNNDVYNDLLNVAVGTVGTQAADELLRYIRYTSDVDFDELFKDPRKLLSINPPDKRMAVYYSMITKLLEKKYKKYAIRIIDFAYYILGNQGNSPHFALAVLALLKSGGINLISLTKPQTFNKFEPPLDGRGIREFNQLVADISDLLY